MGTIVQTRDNNLGHSAAIHLSSEEAMMLTMHSVREAVNIIAKAIAGNWLKSHEEELIAQINLEDVLVVVKERLAEKLSSAALKPFDSVLGIDRQKSVEDTFKDA